MSRGVNNALLDTYQLKSQDAMLEGNLDGIQVLRNGLRLILDISNLTEFHGKRDNFAMREPYDRIIRCFGFRFNDSLFSELVFVFLLLLKNFLIFMDAV